MKKIHIGFGLILVFLMMSVILKPTLLDNLVLMENRHPGYWDYLSTHNADLRIIKSGNENTENELVIMTDVGDYSYGDLHVTVNEDSSISVNGNNNMEKDIWFEYSRGNYLDNGYYRFYDGEASNGQSHSYVVGRCLENGEIIKSEQFDLSKMIEMNRDKYDYCIFGVRIAANAQNINQTFYPMVTTNNKNEIEAAWFSYGNAILPSDTPIVVGGNMTQEERNCISDSDFKILNNEMKSHYKNSDGIVIKIITEDGKIETERRGQY